ncbi:MAG: chromate transporter [Pseudomonadota bacterium]
MRPDAGPPAAPSSARIAAVFLRIAMLSFGGGSLMWAQRVLVEQLRWLSDAQFLDAVSLCQIVPGPNLPNLAVLVGAQYRGLRGAGAALAGVILLPLTILLTAGWLYFRFNDVDMVQAVLTGMSAGAAGTAIAGAVKLAQPYPWTVKSALLALASGAAVAGLQLPLGLVLAVMLPLSIALAWPRRDRA